MIKTRYLAVAIAALLGMSADITVQAASKTATPSKSAASVTKSKNSSSSSVKASTSSVKETIPDASLVSSTTVDEELPYHIEKGYVYTSSKLTKKAGSAKDFAKVTWYIEKKAVIDRSSQGAGNSVWYYVKSGSGTNRAGFGKAISNQSQKEFLILQ